MVSCLQIQQWLNNSTIQPGDWGWIRGNDGSLMPLTTRDPVAPEAVLNNIFCRCTTGCGNRCGCRKAGIRCSKVCGMCQGTCMNGTPVEDRLEDEEISDVDDCPI